MMAILVPVRLESEANARGHWSGKAGRAKSVRHAVTAAFIDAGHPVHVVQVAAKKPGGAVRTCPRFALQPHLPLVVFMTRIAPRPLDDDNAVRAMKSVRDQVAELLGVDDRDPRITWRVDQRKGGVGEYGLEIAIHPRGES